MAECGGLVAGDTHNGEAEVLIAVPLMGKSESHSGSDPVKYLEQIMLLEAGSFRYNYRFYYKRFVGNGQYRHDN